VSGDVGSDTFDISTSLTIGALTVTSMCNVGFRSDALLSMLTSLLVGSDGSNGVFLLAGMTGMSIDALIS